MALAEGNAENASRGIEEMEDKWNSFHDSSLGADYVYDIASDFGFMGGKYTRALEIFAVNEPPTELLGPAVNDGSASAASTPAAGTGGPLPFPYTDMALADLFALRHASEWRFSTDRGWVRQKDGVWVEDKTILRPVSLICAEVGRPYRAQGAQQAQIDVMLNGSRKHQTVELAMRHHPALVVDRDEFDADPWLLNTPGRVSDIRTGGLSPHGALMRMQTAVTPDFDAFVSYERACPVFMRYLEFVADGRPEVIPFLQRWAGKTSLAVSLGRTSCSSTANPALAKPSTSISRLGWGRIMANQSAISSSSAGRTNAHSSSTSSSKSVWRSLTRRQKARPGMRCYC